jgi:hypothetical protein
LYDFSHALRYSFNLLSYDELRSFIAYKFKDSLLQVPGEERIPLFLKDLFSIGLVREVAQSKFDIFQSVEAFDNFFKKYLKVELKRALPFDKECIKVLVSSNPLFISYRNKIAKSCLLLDN